MALSPETLTRHELVGLDVRVVEAANPDLVGIAGRVVSETQGTLSIEGPDGASRVRQVPKEGTTFEFALPDGEYVTVEGARLRSRPELRTEEGGHSTWR